MTADRLVHVIDDDEAMRDSICFLLETYGFAVRAYDSAVAFLAAVPEGVDGCVVTDIRMPGMTGMELVDELRRRDAIAPVVMITGHGDVPLAVQAMKAGVADFIEKPFDDDALVRAIEAALASPVAGADRPAGRETRERLDSLSQRERQVLDGLVAGKPNKIIAYDLGISPRTVEVYRANVMEKMGAGSLSELVRMTVLAG
jgi:two-component system response regulator FixJ